MSLTCQRTAFTILALAAQLLWFPGCELQPKDDDDSTAADDDTADDDTTSSVDADGDGWDETVDCDDHDPAQNLDDADGDGFSTCDGDCDDADAIANLDDDDGDGYSTCDGDCDDADAVANLDDDDGDGYSTCGGDCDDANETVHPTAEDACDETPDNDCDGIDDPQETDDDGDGYSECDGDCDDAEDSIHPGVLYDGCNSLDDDCNGSADDGDGDGDGATACMDCDDADAALNLDDSDGDGQSSCDGDCDDGNATSFDGAEEICDGADNDCDGTPGVDEVDDDGDGFQVCDGDCDDAAADVFPGQVEVVCDDVDNDCDAATEDRPDGDGDGAAECDDCDDTDPTLNLEDLDGDGLTTCDGDCDDGDDTVYPNAAELCDGVDNDCDGAPAGDEVDGDGDSYMVCDGDCDDADAAVHPAETEVCDGLDNDCSGSPGTDEVDADADSYMVCDGDCDDSNPDANPGQAETCDGIDTDCSGAADADEVDVDGDSWMVCEGDCDDAASDVFPGQVEIQCDSIDNDCDASTVDDPDLDGDGAGLCEDCDDGDAALNLDDGDGDGWDTCAGDCDDADADVNPGAVEVECDGVDQDCNGVDPVCSGCEHDVPTDFATIQAAIDAAIDGETICVDPGTYLENINFNGTSVYITGVDGAAATIIDGDGLGTTVTIASGETSDAGMEGFTITGGNATEGGGLYIAGSASPVLTGLVITDNSADFGGGLMLKANALVTISASEISGNEATTSGGGIYADVDSYVLLEEVDFSGNEAVNNVGGGIQVQISEADIVDCDFVGNTAASNGGGIHTHEATVSVEGGTVSGNTAEFGAGVFTGDDSVVQMDGVTITGNDADASGGGLYVDTGASPVLQDVDITSNTAGLNASDGRGGGIYATGAIVEVATSTLEGNSASLNGGGLWAESCDLDLTEVRIDGNSAGTSSGAGGGAIVGLSDAIFTSVTFENNVAASGGGLHVNQDANPNGALVLLDDVVFESNSAEGGDGGGGLCTDNSTDIELNDVVFLSNSSATSGGGAMLGGGTATMVNVLFEENTALGNGSGGGGGLCAAVDYLSVDLENVAFLANSADYVGGGAKFDGGEPTLDNVVFVGNNAEYGGGIWLSGADAFTTNATIVGNEAGTNGGGIDSGCIYAGWVNVNVYSNVAGSAGGGIFGNDDNAFSYSNLYGNSPDDHDLPTVDAMAHSSMISVDPLLLDTVPVEAVDWDLHLSAVSPLIDAGSEDPDDDGVLYGNDPDDPDPDGSRSDIGAYGCPGAGSWDLDGDGYSEWWQPGEYDVATYPQLDWDCDDSDDSIHPGAVEIADGEDNDCDGLVDAADPDYQAICGNGVLEAGEICDDGNVSDDDGCDSLCRMGAGDFEGYLTTMPVGGLSAVVSEDMDLDGYPDLVVTALSGGPRVDVYKSDGTRTFYQHSSVVPFQNINNVHQLAIADMNNDGHPDVVSSASTLETVAVLLNDGAGGLTFSGTTYSCSPNGQMVNEELYDIAVNDLDSDGNADVLCYFAANPGLVSIALGLGDGQLQAPATTAILTTAPGVGRNQTLALEPIDADDHLDLAVGLEGAVEIYLGDGAGGFTFATSLPLTPSGYGAVALCDLDLDSNLDVAGYDRDFDQIDIYLGDGTGAFSHAQSMATELNPQADLTCSYLDNDRIPDLAVAATGAAPSVVDVYHGRGDGTFESYISHQVGAGTGGGMAADDFDDDGAVDLAVSTAGISDSVSMLWGVPATSPCDAPAWGSVVFEDSFETGVHGDLVCGNNDWTTNAWCDATTITADVALCGTQAVEMSGYTSEQNVYHDTGAGGTFTAQVWMYDNLESQVASHLYVNTSGSHGVILGWWNQYFTANYVGVEEDGPEAIDSEITRSDGWHRLAIKRDELLGTTYYYVDGQYIGQTDLGASCDQIRLTGTGSPGPEVYWDGALVYENP